MRKGIVIAFMLISAALNAANYYVATNGSDSNPGSITQPWATWQKGFNSLSAGDILYIRGGNYTGMYGAGHGVNISGHDGSSGNIITVLAYPGETPVLDCSSLSSSPGANYGILLSGCDYWLIKGLTVKNVREYNNLPATSGGTPTTGWELSGSNNITLESCIVTNCGNGFSLNGKLTNINYINCDSYLNYDYWDNGGYCNGFNGNVDRGSTINYTGCRAWSNSDDGYDNMAGAGYMIYTNCWSYRNGKDVPIIGDGDGFKLGFDDSSPYIKESGNQRTLYNCISADNYLMGFDESVDIVIGMDMALYNCVAYKNSRDFGFRFYQPSGTGVTTLKNNISYLNNVNYQGRSRNVSNHNTWDAGAPTVTDADFISIDMTQLIMARKADGSLPDIDFMRLKAGSDMIDAGINVGLPLKGSAPDLGAFETETASTIALPVYTGSAIANATPANLEITYNLTLAGVVPQTSAFVVMVNSVARSVNTIAVSGTKVTLTLASPVVNGDVVTVSYTKPAANPIQTTSGGQAVSLSPKTVTNNCLIAVTPDTVVPPVVPQIVPPVVPPNVPPVVTPDVPPVITPDVPPVIPGSVSGSGSSESVSKIRIYPNPAHNFFNILIEDKTLTPQIIKIFNLSGKLVFTGSIEQDVKKVQIPVNLRTGMYIVSLYSGSLNLFTQKLIINN